MTDLRQALIDGAGNLLVDAFGNAVITGGIVDDPADRIIAQTSATPLVQPLTRRRYEEIQAEKQARLDAWNALTPLERLRIELDEFTAEYNSNLDFSNSTWVQHRNEELKKLIDQTKFKIERWELANAFRAQRARLKS
jgi:hypothetical protein